jgi:hypothetical protein
MKKLTKWSLVGWLCLLVFPAAAALVVQVEPPKFTGSKAIVKLELQNTYTNKIQSVRAAMFLIDSQGKVVGQLTSWVIGGGKDKPPLESNAKTTYNFVIATDKPFTKTKLIVTRILLDGGKLVSLKDVQIQSANGQEVQIPLPTNK